MKGYCGDDGKEVFSWAWQLISVVLKKWITFCAKYPSEINPCVELWNLNLVNEIEN